MSGHEQSATESNVDDASEWDDAYDETENSEEAQNEEAQYEKTLLECQERFPNQWFAYTTSKGQKVGQITDIITECSAAKMYILQGPDAVAGFVSGYEISKEQAEKLSNPEAVVAPPISQEVVVAPVVEQLVNDIPKPTPASLEKAVDQKKAETNMKSDKGETIVSSEQAVDQPDGIDTTTLSAQPTNVVEQQVNGNDNIVSGEAAVDQVKAAEQQTEQSISLGRDSGKDKQGQPADMVVIEKPQPEAKVIQEKKIETATQKVAIQNEKIMTVEVPKKPVEQSLQKEVAQADDLIEQIDVEDVAPEIFEIPHAEVAEMIEPIPETVVSETALEVEADESVESYLNDELIAMDTAVEQIEQTEQSIDVEDEGTDVSEFVAEMADETDLDSAVELETETESEELMVANLQSVLEREQTDDEPEPVKTDKHEAITAAATELVGEIPDIEVREYDPIDIQNRVAAVAEHIEVLESSKNEQECRDAIDGLRMELAALLASLGYRDVDKYVEQIIRNNHNMSELKRIIESLLQAAIADESINDDMKPAIKPHHKFGQWVVQRTTTILQAA